MSGVFLIDEDDFEFTSTPTVPLQGFVNVFSEDGRVAVLETTVMTEEGLKKALETIREDFLRPGVNVGLMDMDGRFAFYARDGVILYPKAEPELQPWDDIDTLGKHSL
jgi:hypothetical protein